MRFPCHEERVGARSVPSSASWRKRSPSLGVVLAACAIVALLLVSAANVATSLDSLRRGDRGTAVEIEENDRRADDALVGRTALSVAMPFLLPLDATSELPES